MSLLGLSLLLPFPFTRLLKTSPLVKASVSQRQGWRLADEEIVSQVRLVLFLAATEIRALIICRSIMLAGHETTSKLVGIFSSSVLSKAVLINSPANICTLGVSQPQQFPG